MTTTEPPGLGCSERQISDALRAKIASGLAQTLNDHAPRWLRTTRTDAVPYGTRRTLELVILSADDYDRTVHDAYWKGRHDAARGGAQKTEDAQ